MKTITMVSGGAFHLPGDNIDTDRIIPARFLKCVTFKGLGDHAFEDDRKQAGGKHPFDQSENRGKPILVTGSNFGSGSSREHAVPALTQFGIQAIIGLSFSAIFRGNAVGNGLVCVEVDQPALTHIVEKIQSGAHTVSINLESKSLTVEHQDEGEPIPFVMPEAHRQMLITGRWDQLATCLEAGTEIEATAERLPYLKIAA